MPHKNILNRIAAAITGTALIFGGCAREEPPPSEVVLTVISDGAPRVSEAVTGEAEISDTELYIPEGMVTKYYSKSYSKRMQDAYDDVVKTVQSFKTKAYMPLTISAEDYSRVLETVRCEQLMLFFLESRSPGEFDQSKHTFEMNFSYKYTVRETNIMLKKTEEAARRIIDMTDSSMSDYEKLKIFHDHLAATVTSSADGPYADSVYGALVEGQALCEGYAKAFSYLCNLSGIENMIVTGFTDVDHMWNMVRLEGKWYHVDVGWDKPSAALLEMYPDMLLYQYFLTDDSVIKNSRLISPALGEVPAADSTDMNYFVKEQLYAESYQEVKEVISRACGKCIDAGEKYFMIKVASSNLYLQAASNLIRADGEGISDIDRIARELNFKGKISYIDYYKNYRIIIFVLE